jgi:hypothetical protein
MMLSRGHKYLIRYVACASVTGCLCEQPYANKSPHTKLGLDDEGLRRIFLGGAAIKV